ncbi:hypothetical protein, partial [Brooklawnia sp.]|uniref:hypothetical protein n=1 Tax=Brooklawnia sp. TaxID=2699740 RepID=UPI00311FFD2A
MPTFKVVAEVASDAQSREAYDPWPDCVEPAPEPELEAVSSLLPQPASVTTHALPKAIAASRDFLDFSMWPGPSVRIGHDDHFEIKLGRACFRNVCIQCQNVNVWHRYCIGIATVVFQPSFWVRLQRLP